MHETWERMVKVNGRGTLLLTQAVLEHMTTHESRIINICSVASLNPLSGMIVYAGTKGMTDSFTRVWARELPRRYGCTVNSAARGPVNTKEMLRASVELGKLVEPLI